MKNFILIASTALFLFGCATVHREQPDTTHIAQQCTAIDMNQELNKNGEANKQRVSEFYLPYAVAALNTYDESGLKDKDEATRHSQSKNFTLAQYQGGWEYKGSKVKKSGLLIDYYFKKKDDGKLEVLIAFRGSRLLSPGDWYSNFSPVLSWIPIKDHYDLARESVAEILKEAQTQAHAKDIAIVTTGHSLGGGLAQHIAYAYPCATAVVFNTSTVTNKHRLREPFSPQIIHIRERGDELNAVLGIAPSKSKSSDYMEYTINLTEFYKSQHSAERLAVSMARMVADCQLDKIKGYEKTGKMNDHAGCRLNDRKARNLYCQSGYGAGERRSKICTNQWPKK